MVSRYDYLKLLVPKIKDELIVTNLGGAAREWYHLKEREGNLYRAYLGGATAIAFGLAVALPHRRVICLDGDGSLLMGLTVLPTIGEKNPSNLIVIVFDNESYEAAGKVPTFTAGATDLEGVARGAGIQNSRTVRELPEFDKAVDDAFRADRASFIIVKTELGYAPVPYAVLDGTANKYRMITYIEKTENIRIIKPPAKKL